VFAPGGIAFGPENGREVVLFADTFNRAYERENLDAALRVLVEGGYRVHLPRAIDGGRHCAAAAPSCRRDWSTMPRPNSSAWSKR
jgi:hypothetical protein